MPCGNTNCRIYLRGRRACNDLHLKGIVFLMTVGTRPV